MFALLIMSIGLVTIVVCVGMLVVIDIRCM